MGGGRRGVNRRCSSGTLSHRKLGRSDEGDVGDASVGQRRCDDRRSHRLGLGKWPREEVDELRDDGHQQNRGEAWDEDTGDALLSTAESEYGAFGTLAVGGLGPQS